MQLSYFFRHTYSHQTHSSVSLHQIGNQANHPCHSYRFFLGLDFHRMLFDTPLVISHPLVYEILEVCMPDYRGGADRYYDCGYALGYEKARKETLKLMLSKLEDVSGELEALKKSLEDLLADDLEKRSQDLETRSVA